MMPGCPARWSDRSRRDFARRGAALLEVLIALALFVAAAAVVTGALNSSLESLERQKLGTHAVNLASSVMAEIQLGIRVPGGEGRRPFEAPFQDWTWEASLLPVENATGAAGTTAGSTRVEVVVRHMTAPVVQRLAQVIRIGRSAAADALTAVREP
jgi:type II secretory pathway pseudopilin PulG